MEEDINKVDYLLKNNKLQVRDYFSYEHFYVLYCKFWELDLDHDYKLTFEVHYHNIRISLNIEAIP